MNIYSVKDIKANRYQGLVLFPNDEMAKRAFSSAINAKDSHGLLNEYPEDVQIWRLGKFDDQTGEITFNSEFLWNGLDFVVKGE